MTASLVVQMVKNLPATQETWVGKIPWRRAWQPTPVFLPGESPWTEEPGGLQSMGLQRVKHDWRPSTASHDSLAPKRVDLGAKLGSILALLRGLTLSKQTCPWWKLSFLTSETGRAIVLTFEGGCELIHRKHLEPWLARITHTVCAVSLSYF